MEQHVYIRVDGNEIIASGHVMRCLSVAEALRKLDIKVIFVVADKKPKALIEGRGFQVDILNTAWNNLNEEIEEFCQYLKNHNVGILLIDSYYVTREYLQNISRYTKIIYIDDLQKFDYPVDLVIHYSPFARMQEYENCYQRKENLPDILLGGEYIPLREEFSHRPFQVNKKVSKILITTGGTDQLNVAGNLLDVLLRNEKTSVLEYHVIIGCFHSNKEGLYELASTHENINIHENIINISHYMRICDVAVSAGGTTLYELCACGIPTICLEIADNQKGAVVWQQQDYMEYAGNAYMDMNKCIKQCEKALLCYIDNNDLRNRRSKKMQQLVDGNGAMRIAKYIQMMEG